MSNDTSLSKHSQFHFNSDIADPLILKYKQLRSSREYNSDVDQQGTALYKVRSVIDSFPASAFLLTASQGIEPPNKMQAKIRSKNGVLNNSSLSELDHINNEYNIGENKTRLTAIVNLDGFDYESEEKYILNYLFSIIVITDIEIETLDSYVKTWIARDQGALAFNFNSIAKDLLELERTTILRYFPADNGRNEELIAVGNKHFLEKHFRS